MVKSTLYRFRQKIIYIRHSFKGCEKMNLLKRDRYIQTLSLYLSWSFLLTSIVWFTFCSGMVAYLGRLRVVFVRLAVTHDKNKKRTLSTRKKRLSAFSLHIQPLL
jgi:hypothetical protein